MIRGWSARAIVPVTVMPREELRKSGSGDTFPMRGQYPASAPGRTISGDTPAASDAISAASRATDQIATSATAPFSGLYVGGNRPI